MRAPWGSILVSPLLGLSWTHGFQLPRMVVVASAPTNANHNRGATNMHRRGVRVVELVMLMGSSSILSDASTPSLHTTAAAPLCSIAWHDGDI
jgi:hypothetical protein